MRPLRLEMRGFGAFREQTEIDFEGLDLFALVGPTGAGKSTIVDGIAFALYGSVARYKSANLVAPVINQLANEARIRLDFTIGGEQYTATRVVRKTAKGASTKEARLEHGDEVLAGKPGSSTRRSKTSSVSTSSNSPRPWCCLRASSLDS